MTDLMRVNSNIRLGEGKGVKASAVWMDYQRCDLFLSPNIYLESRKCEIDCRCVKDWFPAF